MRDDEFKHKVRTMARSYGLKSSPIQTVMVNAEKELCRLPQPEDHKPEHREAALEEFRQHLELFFKKG